MDPLTTAGLTLIIGSISYGVYKFSRKKRFWKCTSTDVKYAFTKTEESPKQKVIDAIEGSRKSLDIAMFLFTEKDIAEHICKATKRGINIRVISDRLQSNNIPNQKENLMRFIHSGIPVKVNTHPGNMHLKIMISDETLITTGSYNFTYPAESKNDEVLVMIRDKDLARRWTKQFNRMWNDQKQYTPYLYQPNKRLA